MHKKPTKEQLEEARKAADYARRTREYHKWRTSTDSRQRRTDATLAVTRIRNAMAPLRSYLGAAPYGPQTAAASEFTARVKKLSLNLQRERRKLWKLCPAAFEKSTTTEGAPSHAH